MKIVARRRPGEDVLRDSAILRRTLDYAYKAARKEKWRRQLTAEWASLDVEGWPS
jgi:hypothetical protein